MNTFQQLKEKINQLSCAEYRYNRLTADFAEHYLEIKNCGFEPLPDLNVLHTWLRLLHKEIRPSLLAGWKAFAAHAGFELGDLIEVNDMRIYAVKINAHPLEEGLHVTGPVAKKDGSPSPSAASTYLHAATVVKTLDKRLNDPELNSMLFHHTTRIINVQEFLEQQLQACQSS